MLVTTTGVSRVDLVCNPTLKLDTLNNENYQRSRLDRWINIQVRCSKPLRSTKGRLGEEAGSRLDAPVTPSLGEG